MMYARSAASCRRRARSGRRSASAASHSKAVAATGCCSTMAKAAAAAAFDWTLVEAHPELARRSSPAESASTTPGRAAARRLCDRRRLVGRPATGREIARQDRRSVRGASPDLTPAACRMRLNGRFGRFGGCYVPEILVPGARATRSRLPRRARRSRIRRRAQRAPRELRGTADSADALPQPAEQHLPEARGPASRRRAQDQPGAGAGASRETHGQDPADRRDRAPASTASRPRSSARCSASRQSSTWAPRTSSGRSSTSSGWS